MKPQLGGASGILPAGERADVIGQLRLWNHGRNLDMDRRDKFTKEHQTGCGMESEKVEGLWGGLNSASVRHRLLWGWSQDPSFSGPQFPHP